MALSEDLSRLSVRAKEAEDRVATAKIEDAEYALLDAVLASMDAQAAAGKVSS